MTSSDLTEVPKECPLCHEVDIRYIPKKSQWHCDNIDCFEFFDGSAPLENTKTFKPQKIFLSYAHIVPSNDDLSANLVERILEKLKQAGHDPWIDKEQLNPGHDWRFGITKGILSSDRILSFLSPRSVRDPGVCLDEIGIAMAHKHGAIATILADERATSNLPASVSHIQYLDMTEWKQQFDMAVTEDWLDGKVKLILDILEKNAGFAGEIEMLAKKLQPLGSASKIGRLIESGLVGRDWVFDAIENWRLHQPNQRLFWILALPGMGKSAIAAHLVHWAKLRVVAYHFCDYTQPETRSLHRFVLNLAFMLSARLPAYRALVLGQLSLLEKELETYSAQYLMEQLIVTPLRNHIDGGQVDDRLIIVIDALDEADLELTKLIAEQLQNIPAWLGVVITSRPSVKPYLENLPAYELTVNDQNNLNDLQTYVSQWEKVCPDITPNIQAQLLQAAAGQILYLVMVKRAFEDGRMSIDHLQSLPPSLGGLYHVWFVRAFGECPQQNPQWSRLAYPLLALLCVTPMPLPVNVARKICNWVGQEPAEVRNVLSGLITWQEEIQLNHKSLSEWLTGRDSRTGGESLFWVNTQEATLKLASWLYKQIPQTIKKAEIGYEHLAIAELLNQLTEDNTISLMGDNPKHVIEQFDSLCECLMKVKITINILASLAINSWLIKQAQAFCKEDKNLISNLNYRLARIHSSLGNHISARKMYEDIYTECLHRLGKEHNYCLRAQAGIATALHDLGDYLAAKSLREEVLSLRQKLLGKEHFDTISAMNSLSNSMNALGEYLSAKLIREEVFRLREKLLGKEHIETISAMSNLASSMSALGDYSSAKIIREEVLALRLRLLGKEHPSTISAMSNLANTLRMLGEYSSAKLIQEDVLSLCRKLLGKEHSDTISTMNDLAITLSKLEDYVSAKSIREEVVTLRRKGLGVEHPYTLVNMSNLATSYRNMGDYLSAKALHEEVLKLREKVLGKKHPSTIASMNHLANSLVDIGELMPAKALFEKVIRMRKKVLGENHPKTINSMRNLALAFKKSRDYSSAKTMLDKVLELRRKHLGDKHPETINSIMDLAETLEVLGEYPSAKLLHEEYLALIEKKKSI